MAEEHGYRLKAPKGTIEGPYSKEELQYKWDSRSITDQWEVSHTLAHDWWVPVTEVVDTDIVERRDEAAGAEQLDDKEPDPREVRKALAGVNAPKGLGGWLILVGIQLWVGLVQTAVGLDETMKASAEFPWEAAKTRLPELYDLMNVTVGAAWFFTLAIIVLIYLYHAKKRHFPGAFVATNVGAVMAIGYLGMLWDGIPGTESAEMVAEYSGTAIGMGVWTVIWALYLLKSERVKATFVN